METPHLRRFTVPESLAGARLDVALAQLAEGWSRSRLQALVRARRVRVDGAEVCRPRTAVEAGARLEVDFPAAEPATTPDGEAITGLEVLHEDEHIVVIDKPAGLVAHPNTHFQTGTVSHLAEGRFGELPRVQGEDRPGIVHRLDRLTSGVMVIGRSPEAIRCLKEQFKGRRVDKTYLAIVHGVPRFDSEWIEKSIAPVPRHPDRFRVVSDGEGREASTYVETRERFRGFALLECKPKTGRTHQIRVHVASGGHPIVGDRVYHHPGPLPVPLPEDAPHPKRQALHARALSFEHPASGERVRFEAPLPDDMRELLEWLRANAPE